MQKNIHPIHAFTLIEMVLVIVIIGILMLMVFRFGSSRLQQLQMQTTKETILGFREDVINNNRSSSYIGDQHYDNVTIGFTNNDSQITANYYTTTGASMLNEHSTMMSNVTWHIRSQKKQTIATLSLVYKPYELGCSINDGAQQYSGAILQLAAVANPSTYCFAIQYQTCTIQEMECPDFTVPK